MQLLEFATTHDAVRDLTGVCTSSITCGETLCFEGLLTSVNMILEDATCLGIVGEIICMRLSDSLFLYLL
jgi:hypothetical protein